MAGEQQLLKRQQGWLLERVILVIFMLLIVIETLSVSQTNGAKTRGENETPSTSTNSTQVPWFVSANTFGIFGEPLNSDCEPQVYGAFVHGQTRWDVVSTMRTTYLSVSDFTQLGTPSGSKSIGGGAQLISSKTGSKSDVLGKEGRQILTTGGGTTKVDLAQKDSALEADCSIGERALVAEQSGVHRGGHFNLVA